MAYLFFLLFGIIAVISAVLVVSLKKIIYCALFLALFLLSVAGLFFLLDADFLGIVQILLYIGGVIVLILFAVMLTAKVSTNLLIQTNEQKLISLIICFILFIIIGYVTVTTNLSGNKKTPELSAGIIREVGKLLMTVYVLPFEIASLVLLIALIGATVLVSRRGDD